MANVSELKRAMEVLLPHAHQYGLTISIESEHLAVEKMGLAFAITRAEIVAGNLLTRFTAGVKLLLMLTEYGVLNADNPSNGTQTG